MAMHLKMNIKNIRVYGWGVEIVFNIRICINSINSTTETHLHPRTKGSEAKIFTFKATVWEGG